MNIQQESLIHRGGCLMKITQDIYDTAIFLSRCVYYEIEGVYPKPYDKCLTFEAKYTGLKMNVFDMGDYHIAVLCGTNDWHDVIADVKVGLHIIPRQLHRAKEAIHKLEEKPIVFVGHSLGGFLAGMLHSVFKHKSCAICLNPCGYRHLLRDEEELNILNVITKHDILNNITRNIPFAKKYLQLLGEIVILEDRYWFPLSIKAHSDFTSMAQHRVE